MLLLTLAAVIATAAGTAIDQTPVEKADCKDDPDFSDKDGYFCNEWGPANDFPCEAAEDEGYSAAEAKEIATKCDKSCGFCTVAGEDPNCKDDPDFTDKEGYFCDEWGPANDFPCDGAEEEGYSAAEAKEIATKCEKSCGFCGKKGQKEEAKAEDKATTAATTQLPASEWRAEASWADNSPGTNERHSNWRWGGVPSRALDSSTATHAAFEGTSGFLVLDLGAAQQVTQFRMRNDGDLADVKDVSVQSGSSLTGPWSDLGTLALERSTAWQTLAFSASARYFKVSWQSNHGFSVGTRVVDLQLFIAPSAPAEPASGQDAAVIAPSVSAEPTSGEDAADDAWLTDGSDAEVGCENNDDFVDHLGYSCLDWGPTMGFPCTDEVFEEVGYSDGEGKAVQANCREECEICDSTTTTTTTTTTTPSRPPPLVPPSSEPAAYAVPNDGLYELVGKGQCLTAASRLPYLYWNMRLTNAECRHFCTKNAWCRGYHWGTGGEWGAHMACAIFPEKSWGSPGISETAKGSIWGITQGEFDDIVKVSHRDWARCYTKKYVQPHTGTPYVGEPEKYRPR